MKKLFKKFSLIPNWRWNMQPHNASLLYFVFAFHLPKKIFLKRIYTFFQFGVSINKVEEDVWVTLYLFFWTLHIGI